MRYLSVCSGIEAASVAWHPLGWGPLAFSEIEPFPRAVLAHHYPDVPVHGDFTKLRDEDFIADADVLVGGTPCQAFSVAGLRKSLDDDRGNLSLEFVRLADAIDDLRHAAGREPAIVVWENVPGVLSVKDNAFGCFLAGLAGDVTPYDPPRGKWTDAGVVDGPQRTVAWRVLDAQYFGLAQRRRRVFVVASAREGFDPAAVLLEWEGVRRDTPPRRKAGQVASTIPSRSTAGGGLGTDFDLDGGVIQGSVPDVVGTLDTECGGGKLTHQSLANGHVIGTITARMFNALGVRDVEEGAVLPCYLDPLNQSASTEITKTIAARTDMDCAGVVTHSLRGEGFDASEDGTGRGTPLVPVHAHGFYQNQGSHGSGDNDELSPTLKAADSNNLAAAAIAFSYKDSGNDASADLSLTLRALGAYDANGGGQMAIAYAFQPRIARNGRGDMGEIVNALNAQSGETGKGDAAPCVAIGVQASQSGVRLNETAGTLDANYGPRRHNGVMQHMAVRRLTPVECERLQGFPDNYTMIPWKKKPADQCPDGPRYKALGNSMAVPVMRWIGSRIAEQVK